MKDEKLYFRGVHGKMRFSMGGFTKNHYTTISGEFLKKGGCLDSLQIEGWGGGVDKKEGGGGGCL